MQEITFKGIEFQEKEKKVDRLIEEKKKSQTEEKYIRSKCKQLLRMLNKTVQGFLIKRKKFKVQSGEKWVRSMELGKVTQSAENINSRKYSKGIRRKMLIRHQLNTTNVIDINQSKVLMQGKLIAVAYTLRTY